MASGQFAGAYRQIARLFKGGCVSGLSEGQLLDRFVTERDDNAFEAIVARHGPTVLGVCRAVLNDPNDVEDAFQATFLVLVKKAETLRDRDLLGNWLYGVAYRVAKRARSDAAKRHDRRPIGPEPAAPAVNDFDLRPSLHDEVNRLPESYRAAVVLCYLEGRTHEEAARELGWPIGTVRGRLARARDLLRSRLTRRGLALTSGGLLASLAREANAAVSPLLLEITRAAALSVAARSLSTAIAVSPRVLALAQGVSHAMSATSMKLGMTLLVAVALTAPGVSAFQGPEVTRGRPPALGPVAKAESKAQDFGKTAGIKASPAKEASDDRIPMAEEALAIVEKTEKSGRIGVSDPQRVLWSRRLIDAQIEAGTAEPDVIARHVAQAKAAEQLVETLYKQGQATKLGYLNAHFDRLEAEKFAKDALEKKSPTPVASGIPPGGEGGAYEHKLRKFPRQNPADAERNEVIEQAMEQPVKLDFKAGTSLEEILDYIRKNTVNASVNLPEGLPIYVDPFVSHNDMEDPPKPRKLPTLVALHFDGIPIRVALRLILDQNNLAFAVRDQVVYIINEDRLDMRRADGFFGPPSTPGGMVGMMSRPLGTAQLNPVPVNDPIQPGTEIARAQTSPQENLLNAKRNKAIEKQLGERLTMSFPNPTPLEDILKYIRSKTSSEALDLPSGVPIYVDPIGLAEAKATITSPVALDLEGISLRTTLRLILRQVGLNYRVLDGLIYISSTHSIPEDGPIPQPAPKGPQAGIRQ